MTPTIPTNGNSGYQAKLERLFEHHQPLFKKTYDEAFADFNKDFGRVRHKFVKRDYANNMHVCVRHRVKQNFANVDGAYPIELANKPFTLILDGSVIGINVIAVIIFKKQSESLATTSIQTDAVKNFNSQVSRLSEYVPHIQLALPWQHAKAKVANPPKAKSANIVAGYKPNALFTGYERLAIAFPLSRHAARLVADFTHAAESGQVIQMPRPQRERPAAKRVRRRTASENTEERRKSRKHLKEVKALPQTDHIKRRKDGEGG